MDSAWFHAYVSRCHQRRSLLAPEAWVEAHLEPQGRRDTAAAARGARKVVGGRATHSSRNDARTVSTASGSGLDLSFPPGSTPIDNYDIFADLSLHDQAAATIASASQSKSGFSANMSTQEGVALENFRAYLEDFIAPHWLMTYYKEQQVHHEQSNHSKFVDDLVNIIVEGVRAVGGDQDALGKAEESVRSLAKRLSSNTSREERLTIFSSFWMDRNNSTDPVIYGIFYTTLHARYVQNGKTEVLSSTTATYSVIFNLLSGVLIQHAPSYNRLLKSSVDDWLSGHDI